MCLAYPRETLCAAISSDRNGAFTKIALHYNGVLLYLTDRPGPSCSDSAQAQEEMTLITLWTGEELLPPRARKTALSLVDKRHWGVEIRWAGSVVDSDVSINCLRQVL